MMDILLRWVISALVVLGASYILPGVIVDGFTTALIVALVLGIINAFIKPVVTILTLPINIVTLGLFTFVINALMVLLADYLIPGFTVDGFIWALAFSILLSIINMVLDHTPANTKTE